MSRNLVPKKDFEKTLRSLTDELWHHANSGPGSEEIFLAEVKLRGCFRSAADLARLGQPSEAGGHAQFDLWWTNCPTQGLPVLLWDRWECHGLTRAEYESLLSLARNSDLELALVLDDWEWMEPPAALTPQATWAYHPERMRGVLPFASRVAEIGRQCKGNPSVNELNDLADAWSAADSRDFAAKPLRARIASPSRKARGMSRVIDMLMFNAVFCANGRQIFEMPSQLCEMFRRTDVDDISAEHIKVPYPGIYLHFGPQRDLALDSEWTPEGAYVYELSIGGDGDRALQFCIVFAPTDLERYRQFDINIEPVYVQALGPQHMKMALGEAVDLVLAARMQQLRREVSDEPMAQVGSQTQEFATEHGVRLVSVQAKRAAEELDALEPLHRTYLEMLKLIVNSLAYLTAYPKDVETRWPKNAPAFLLKELDKTDSCVFRAIPDTVPL